MTMPDPLAVIDVDDGWPPSEAYRQQVCAWLSRHDVDPKVTYRVKVYLIDAPFARVFQHALDKDGRAMDDGFGSCVHREPFDVLLSEMPPSLGGDA